jgi:Tol biopolymer transport system component
MIGYVPSRYGNRDIYVMDASGAHVQRLTTDAEAESDPSWKR